MRNPRNSTGEPSLSRHRGPLAGLQPVPPEVLTLRAALRDRPEDATRFVLASHHRLPREAFFNPDNLARILGSSPGLS